MSLQRSLQKGEKPRSPGGGGFTSCLQMGHFMAARHGYRDFFLPEGFAAGAGAAGAAGAGVEDVAPDESAAGFASGFASGFLPSEFAVVGASLLAASL